MFQKTHFSEGATAWVAPSLLYFRSIVAKAACHLARSGCPRGGYAHCNDCPTTKTTRSFSTMSATASILRSSKTGSTPERTPNSYETARGQIAFSRRVFQNNGLFAKNLGRNGHKLWTFFSYLPTLPERVPRSTPCQPTKRGFRPTICSPSAWFRACLRRIIARRCAPRAQTLLRKRRHQPSSAHGAGNRVHRLRRSAAAARRF